MQFLVLSRVRPGVIGIVVVLLLLLAVSPAGALEGYNYAQTINYSAGTTSEYQQELVIHRSSGTPHEDTSDGLLQATGNVWHLYVEDRCREDYGDIRLTDAAGTEVPYYLWPDHTSESARIIVRIPAPAPGAIMMWYGSPETTTTSNGGATFFYFDDYDYAIGGLLWPGYYGLSFVATHRLEGSYWKTSYHSHTVGELGLPDHPVHISAMVKGRSDAETMDLYYAFEIDDELLGDYVCGGNRWWELNATTTTDAGLHTLRYLNREYNYHWMANMYWDQIVVRAHSDAPPSAVAFSALPIAAFSASPTHGCFPLTVQFTDTSVNTPPDRSWDFGDGTMSTDQNPSHTYAAAGIYTVTLTTTNHDGSDTETKTDLITVYEPGPYYVATYADLCKVGTAVDGWTPDSDYIQTADIQCPAGSNFMPIGTIYDWFTGSYDGQGYVIRDLCIDKSGYREAGLFWEIGGGAVITNVALENVSITGSEYVGGLVGCLYGSGNIIENCTVSGMIVGETRSEYIGGLVGCLYGSGNIVENCTVSGMIVGRRTGSYSVGGLVGYAEIAEITNCHANVDIRGDMLIYAGGLVGYAEECTISSCTSRGDILYADEECGGLIGCSYKSIVTDCHAHGDVRIDPDATYKDGPNGGLIGYQVRGSTHNSSATGTVAGGEWATGGLVGYGDRANVTRCCATGDVSGFEFVGGLIGEYEGRADATLEDCYATGAVVSSGSDPARCAAGGLIGAWNQDSLVQDGHIKTAYSAGNVSAPNLPAERVGGLIGKITDSTGMNATACYWDTQTSGQATSAGGAIGKTTAEMQALSTFNEWNIATVENYNGETWFLVEGEDYPRLAWEGLPDATEPTPTPTPPATGAPGAGPLPVRFVVQSYTGQRLENVTVTATPLESTGPLAWLYDLFGVSGDADPSGTVLKGSTDTSGGIVLPLIRTVKYRVAVTDLSRGIDTAITIYPQEDAVVLTVWPQEPPGPANDFQLYAGEEGRDIRVGVRYATSDLTRITFTVTTEAGDVLARKVSTDQAGDLTYVIDGRPGEVYLYGYVAEHKTAGVLRQDQYVRFAGEDRPWVDFADWIPMYAYQWSAIAILVGFGTTFMRGEIRGGMLTIPIIAGILQVIGWLQIPWIIVGVALVIGVLVYARMSESDLGI